MFYHFGHSIAAIQWNSNPTRLASQLGIFNLEIGGCSPGEWFIPLGLGRFHQLHAQALMKICPLFAHSELSSTFTPHRHPISEFLVGERCSTCVEAWRTCFGVAQSIGLPYPNTTPPFPPTARLDNADTSFTALPLHVCLLRGL
jgi:hypothetical protein